MLRGNWQQCANVQRVLAALEQMSIGQWRPPFATATQLAKLFLKRVSNRRPPFAEAIGVYTLDINLLLRLQDDRR
jgi:hypothetical protein